MSTSRETLFTEARRTPLTRGAIAELAGRVDLATVAELAPIALEVEGAHVATVLAAIAVTSGKKLDRAFARGLVPELGSIELFGPMALAVDGDVVELLLDLLDEGRSTLELESHAVLLATDVTVAEKREISRRLVVHARRLARHEIGPEATILLGGAASRLGDAFLAELAAPLIAKAKRGKRAVDDAIAMMRRSLASALEETGQRMTGGDYTVRKDGPEVGRNDPCPCGSGAKYKKCCALKPKTTTFEVPRIDEATLHPEQASMLRASELERLDAKRIPSRSLISVYRRALRFRRWALAERFLAEMRGRKDIKEPGEYLLEMLDEGLAVRDREIVEATVQKLPPKLVPEALHLEIACLGGAPDLLARIEKAALVALESEHQGVDAIELALVLLRNYPALGILTARGTLHEGRKHDSTAVLEAMEDARDRLLLPPIEPFWDFFEGMIEGAVERKKERAEDDKRAALEKELRRARAESRGAEAQANKLKKRLEELDTALSLSTSAAPAAATAASAAPPSKPEVDDDGGKLETLEEERRRLRGKVDELQRIIGQGQEERRELRKKLTEIEEAPATTSAPSPEPEREEEEEEDPEGSTDERPRNILVPAFGDRAAKTLAELDGAAAEIVLGVVASLAAGRENAWGGVKKLTKLKAPFFSARAGIHHRVLFAIDERALVVHEVIHRRDLEQAVNRLVRA